MANLPEFAPDGKNGPYVPAVATLTDNSTGIVYSFPFNINNLSWNYQMNNQSFDTVGGRVTQLLSVRINTMELQGEAGSRKKLLDLYTNFNTIQDNQNTNKVSSTLTVPSRGLQYKVWLDTMQIAWDFTTVTYPYIMTFQVEQDISSINTTDALTNAALDSLVDGIGYNNYYNGMGNTTNVITFGTLYLYVNRVAQGDGTAFNN